MALDVCYRQSHGDKKAEGMVHREKDMVCFTLKHNVVCSSSAAILFLKIHHACRVTVY